MSAGLGNQPRIGALRLPRLSAPRAPGDDPTFADLGLAALAKECRYWQLGRDGGTFWELNAGTSAGHRDSWREIPVLMGSVAEAALLAGSAEVEIECLRRAVDVGTLPPEYGLSVRFFAEAQGQMLLGCGHRLANIGVRVMMLANGYPWGKDVPRSTPFPPNSDNRKDWILMRDLRKYRAAAPASGHAGLERLIDVVLNLEATPEWRALNDERGRDFHRAREESPFVAGARRVSVWKIAALSPSVTQASLEYSDENATPAEITAWTDQLGIAPRAVMLGLPTAMAAFMSALAAAMTEITGGTFTI